MDRKCQKCHKKKAKYIRKFDIDKVPTSYFMRQDDNCADLLINYHKIDYYSNKFYFLKLPKEYLLTKYNYYVCKKCFDIEAKEDSMVWNSWEKIN